jgi:hypothetical protein
MLTAFFDSKAISHHEFVPEKQTENGKFHKEIYRPSSLRYLVYQGTIRAFAWSV